MGEDLDVDLPPRPTSFSMGGRTNLLDSGHDHTISSSPISRPSSAHAMSSSFVLRMSNFIKPTKKKALSPGRSVVSTAENRLVPPGDAAKSPNEIMPSHSAFQGASGSQGAKAGPGIGLRPAPPPSSTFSSCFGSTKPDSNQFFHGNNTAAAKAPKSPLRRSVTFALLPVDNKADGGPQGTSCPSSPFDSGRRIPLSPSSNNLKSLETMPTILDEHQESDGGSLRRPTSLPDLVSQANQSLARPIRDHFVPELDLRRSLSSLGPEVIDSELAAENRAHATWSTSSGN